MLSNQITEDLKAAMKAKDQVALRAIRAIKAAFLLLKTDGSGDVTEEDEINALTKMAKQRKDSMNIFKQQNRMDLYAKEAEELAVIERYLPAQMTEDEATNMVEKIIQTTGAQGLKDMGKVMGAANSELKGRFDGKALADLVKKLLG
jgi:uncharacterized protein YqeY